MAAAAVAAAVAAVAAAEAEAEAAAAANCPWKIHQGGLPKFGGPPVARKLHV